MHRPRHSLIAHPSNRPSANLTVAASVGYDGVGGLDLRFRVCGTGGALRLPAPAAPRREDGLWRHTCMEAFVGVAGSASYREFNFSPSGCWAAYGFSATRCRDDFDVETPCHCTCGPLPDGFALEAVIPAAWLPAGASLTVALSTVLEADDGTLGYWALRHPPGQPDFHWPGARCLTLPDVNREERG
ncbi:MAG: DOMON-like domain-containing protein [Rhodocyclaceae bacterium]|nr:DOMON-like domain-containing protein [Rhodocyclaceae bacterium]